MGKTTVAKPAAAPTARVAGTTPAELESKLKDLKLDPRGDGMYSGTFRWLETKQFALLPDWPAFNNNDADTALCLTKGWEGFLKSRSSRSATDLVEGAKRDPSCLDALSFPVTFLHVASLLQLVKAGDNELHVVVLGATRKAEQRVWLITDYWFEIAHFLSARQITLWFVGPEVDTACRTRKAAQPANLSVKHVQGTFTGFRKRDDASRCTPSNTILIGFNTGFGNFVDSGRFDLLFSWLPDLYAITNANFPAIFTCANDYADMNGEFAVQSRIVGAKMLLLPQQNPFSMASHLHEEGKKEAAWSRGNSFLYAVQGCELARRLVLKSGDVISLQNRLDASLDLHLKDALGRHFYKGMVLSKEQAARCKALQSDSKPSFSPSSSPTKHQSARPRSSSASSAYKTPTFEIRPGAQPGEVVILVHVPGVDATRRIAVDVSDVSLSLVIPDMYALRVTLPFHVENNAPVRAQLTPPFLSIACTRRA